MQLIVVRQLLKLPKHVLTVFKIQLFVSDVYIGMMLSFKESRTQSDITIAIEYEAQFILLLIKILGLLILTTVLVDATKTESWRQFSRKNPDMRTSLRAAMVSVLLYCCENLVAKTLIPMQRKAMRASFLSKPH